MIIFWIIHIIMIEPITSAIEAKKIIFKISGSLTKNRLDALKHNIEESEKLIKNTSKKNDKKINILLDITEFDGTYDVEAMEMMAAFAKHNAQFIEKTAVFGGSNKTITIGKITIALAGRENFKFFTTKEEAEKWLE